VATLSGWIALLLMGYVFVALFYVAAGAKRALTLASTHGDLQSEAKNALGESYRARFLWLKRHRSQLPSEVQALAARVVTVELSCWVAVVVLFVIYGLQFVAL
jgi:hypothetical protein